MQEKEREKDILDAKLLLGVFARSFEIVTLCAKANGMNVNILYRATLLAVAKYLASLVQVFGMGTEVDAIMAIPEDLRMFLAEELTSPPPQTKANITLN